MADIICSLLGLAFEITVAATGPKCCKHCKQTNCNNRSHSRPTLETRLTTSTGPNDPFNVQPTNPPVQHQRRPRGRNLFKPTKSVWLDGRKAVEQEREEIAERKRRYKEHLQAARLRRQQAEALEEYNRAAAARTETLASLSMAQMVGNGSTDSLPAPTPSHSVFQHHHCSCSHIPNELPPPYTP